MTAPRRWKDTHDAPVGVRELLSAGRRPRPIDGATFERGASRVAKLGVAPVAAAAGVAIGMWAKLAAAAVIGVASVGAVVAVNHVVTADAERGIAVRAQVEAQAQADAKAQAEAKAQAAAQAKAKADANAKADADADAKAKAEADAKAKADAQAEAEASARAALASAGAGKVEPVSVAAQVPAAVVAPAVEDAPKASPATIGAELALLEEARASLARDPTTSLARIAQHRARFPSGVLGAERDLIELDALRRSGRTTEARAHARSWLDREPSGLHAPRVRAILATLDRTPD